MKPGWSPARRELRLAWKDTGRERKDFNPSPRLLKTKFSKRGQLRQDINIPSLKEEGRCERLLRNGKGYGSIQMPEPKGRAAGRLPPAGTRQLRSERCQVGWQSQQRPGAHLFGAGSAGLHHRAELIPGIRDRKGWNWKRQPGCCQGKREHSERGVPFCHLHGRCRRS